MKTTVTIFLHILFVFLLRFDSFSQDTQTELDFYNYSTTRDLTVTIIPYSALFTVFGTEPNVQNVYSLAAHTFESYNNNQGVHIRFDYISGLRLESNTNEKKNSIILPHNNGGYEGFNWDPSGTHTSTGNLGAIGVGKYKLVFSWSGGEGESDACTVERDSDYPNFEDLTFYFRDQNGTPTVYYQWNYNYGGYSGEVPIASMNRTLQNWKPWPDQYSTYNRPKKYGNYAYNNSNSNYNLYAFPLDARIDCNIAALGPDQNLIYSDPDRLPSGDLVQNVIIQKSVFTPDGSTYPVPSGEQTPLKINVMNTYEVNSSPHYSGSTLSIGPNNSLTLNTIPNRTQPSMILSIFPFANLQLNLNSSIIINKGCQLFVDCRANMTGKGRVIVKSGGVFIYKENCDNPYTIDSNKIELEDSASLQIPDNVTLQLSGSESSLKLGYNSEVLFGENSKLIFQNGAHLYANGTKFITNTEGGTWDGIYLYDLAQDTITNCIIENSTAGINIINRHSSSISPPPYSTEISNCTFTNTTTSSQLTNAIYANNSNNLLIKNNTISSNITEGYVSGITLDYCGSGIIDIIDNTLSNVASGISIIHSSPYVARNSISGPTNNGDGLFLDNCNGTIKNNNINNFTYSLSGDYSSPYLLKNTFNNAYNKGIYLKTSSVPVMKLIASGSTLRWLGGNNTVSGTPSTSGLWFGTDAYPLMDSGYNNILVNGADYMVGTVPASLDGILDARLNYWQATRPNTSKFNVTSGSVTFSPYNSSSTMPSTNGYELNSIGFGLYDTVYTSSGDNPLADVLFIQAYLAENQSDYTTAISKYKDVINDYNNSSYAPISLSKIFNCLEKMRANATNYQNIRTYYNAVKSNENYTTEVRETAEDLAIKAKFRQGLVDDAISDYQTMFQQNTNTPKGVHALINKECLIAMKGDTTDVPNSTKNTKGISIHLRGLYSLLYGEGIFKNSLQTTIPTKFVMHQNYPNPFNPQTTIKFEVPYSAQVSIRVYDLLGREVWNYKDIKTTGSYSVTFDGSNLASGVYFYRLEAGNFVESKKMVLIK